MTQTEIYSRAMERSISVGRIVGSLKGKDPGPCVIFFGGMHGNEPSGLFALERVMRYFKDAGGIQRGAVYGISGNLPALERGDRYIDTDLNRLWSKEQVKRVMDPSFIPSNSDEREQLDICRTVRSILDSESGPFYFMDLHSTSSDTIPFVVVNDSLLNRAYTKQYPLPIILGIEEYLDGPLLSYINELGYVAFGYEGGQHDDLSAIENHVAFIMLSLVFTGIVPREHIDFDHFFNQLAKHSVDARDFFEIFHRHKIDTEGHFQMRSGFVNFQNVRKGEELANSNGCSIKAPASAKIFMPLYQAQGSEGFFIIRRIPKVFLRLSKFLRKVRADRVLAILPGVRWVDESSEALRVDRRIARFFTKQVFHLLGYRSRVEDEYHYIMRNREAASREEDYSDALWFEN